MSNLESFLTGFFGRTAEIHKDNRERADDYYAKQLERAQTTGMAKLQERRAKVNKSTQMADALATQAGVPPAILKRVAEGGLDNLDQVQTIWEDAQSKGIKTDRSFWEGVYGAASAESDTTGEDFSTAFSRIAGANLKPAPKEETGSKRGWGEILFNTDAIDGAWDKLNTTKIEGDLTAGDILRSEGQEEVTGRLQLPNIGYLAEREAQVTAEQKSLKPPTDEDIFRAQRYYDDAVKEIEEQQDRTAMASMPPEEREIERRRMRQEASNQATQELVSVLGQDRVEQLLPHLFQTQEAAPVETTPITGGPVAEAPVQKSAASNELPVGVKERITDGSAIYTFDSVAPDGRIVYKSSAGGKFSVARDRVMDQDKGVSAPSEQGTQQRLDAAIQKLATGNFTEAEFQDISDNQLFIGKDEAAPTVLNHPGFGPCTLIGEDSEYYYYQGSNGEAEQFKILKK